MTGFDFIIAGGGAAGLGLAYELCLSNLRDQKILIVDRDAKNQNDHTWRYWADGPTRFDHFAYRTWEQIEVVDAGFKKLFDIRPYQYRLIRGIDYYQGLRETLSAVPNLTFLQARVDKVENADDPNMAQVVINNKPVGARWAFDTTYNLTDIASGPRRFHYLKRHFKGWEIETSLDCFDSRTVTLYDFRTPQKGCMRFFSVHPFTRRRALVEYNLFSPSLLKGNEYDRALSEYIENVRGIRNYRIDSTETGIIPLTDRPYPRRLGRRVMAIGIKGGLVKPSTGDAFLRTQKDAQAVVNSLTNTGNPFQVPQTPLRFIIADSLLLHGLQQHGDRMAGIIMRQFRENSIQDWFRLNDENGSLLEVLRIVSPLLQSLYQALVSRKIAWQEIK